MKKGEKTATGKSNQGGGSCVQEEGGGTGERPEPEKLSLAIYLTHTDRRQDMRASREEFQNGMAKTNLR